MLLPANTHTHTHAYTHACTHTHTHTHTHIYTHTHTHTLPNVQQQLVDMLQHLLLMRRYIRVICCMCTNDTVRVYPGRAMSWLNWNSDLNWHVYSETVNKLIPEARTYTFSILDTQLIKSPP